MVVGKLVNPLRQGRRDRWFESSLPYQFFALLLYIFLGLQSPFFASLHFVQLVAV